MAEALLVTLLAFGAASLAYRRGPSPWTNPVGTSVLLLVLYVKLGPLSLETYQAGTAPLVFLLKPAVVALGWLLWRERRWLRVRGVPLGVGLVAGSLTSLLVTPLLARAFGAGPVLQQALALKSVSSAIAVDLAGRLGVEVGLSVPLIILTGIFGAAFAVPLLRRLGVTDPFALGLALGVNSHGIGTARAVEEGALATAVSGLAMGLTGVTTAVLAPWVFRLLGLP